MTVVCYDHREEIESAITYHDDRLVIYQTYGNDDGAAILWHPDWVDDEDEKEFVNNAHIIGLGRCSYYESEARADYMASEYVLLKEIAEHSRGLCSDTMLLEDLHWHSIKLLLAGYVTFHQFSHRLIDLVASALGESQLRAMGGKVTAGLIIERIPHLYVGAALAEDLDDMVARMCDPLPTIRNSRIPAPGQHESIEPSWRGILFDECPVSRNW